MVLAKSKSERDRREADLVLRVAITHWAVNSAKVWEDRKTAHDIFKDAVRKLHEFVVAEPDQGFAQTERAGTS